jgi:thiosulfate/3-mercaptopyruvate sulfurtransferase
MARSDVLVDGDWLEKHLGDVGIAVVEVDENTEAHGLNHIPGAIQLDWQRDLRHPARRDVVDQAGFEALLSAKGVSAEDTVVLYGGDNNWFAAYAYWYFKLYGHQDVRLLDGGRKKWELESRSLDDLPVNRPATTYVARPADTSIRAFRDDVVAAIGTHAILDVRSPAEFSGEILAPAHFPQEQPQVRGHVPTAVNVPWSKAATEDGSFRSDDELRELYAEVLDGRPITAYCRIGERSAHSWFVLHELLDAPDVRNYDGSWVEYGSLVGVPIELGDGSNA